MILTPIFLLATASYIIFLVLHSIQQWFHHRSLSKALNCEPAPPGPRGPLGLSWLGIPAFLALTKAVREKRWIDFVSDQYAVFGNTFRNSIFGRRMVATIEPENVKAILATQFQDFSLGTRHEQFYPLLGDGIFTMDGAGWSHARGLLRPQFTRDQV